jgi:UDP-glucose 4-epimerase
MKVLITGGSGQLASYLFEEMSAEHDVTGVDIRRPAHQPAMGRVTMADIRDLGAMTEAAKGCEVIVHTAAQVSVQRSTEDPSGDADTNVMGTISVLRAAAAAGVRKVVYISSAAVYGDPQRVPVDETHPLSPKSFYGASKLCGEHYTGAAGSTLGLEWVVIRPFNFYSPRADPTSPYSGVITKFAQAVKDDRPLRIEGDGLQTRDFLHARDVARMVSLAASSDVTGETFNCGSGRGTSIKELADAFSRIFPEKVAVEHAPPRTSDIRDSVAQMAKAERLLGFRTSIGLEEGLRGFFQ